MGDEHVEKGELEATKENTTKIIYFNLTFKKSRTGANINHEFLVTFILNNKCKLDNAKYLKSEVKFSF